MVRIGSSWTLCPVHTAQAKACPDLARSTQYTTAVPRSPVVSEQHRPPTCRGDSRSQWLARHPSPGSLGHGCGPVRPRPKALGPLTQPQGWADTRLPTGTGGQGGRTPTGSFPWGTGVVPAQLCCTQEGGLWSPGLHAARASGQSTQGGRTKEQSLASAHGNSSLNPPIIIPESSPQSPAVNAKQTIHKKLTYFPPFFFSCFFPAADPLSKWETGERDCLQQAVRVGLAGTCACAGGCEGTRVWGHTCVCAGQLAVHLGPAALPPESEHQPARVLSGRRAPQGRVGPVPSWKGGHSQTSPGKASGQGPAIAKATGHFCREALISVRVQKPLNAKAGNAYPKGQQTLPATR